MRMCPPWRDEHLMLEGGIRSRHSEVYWSLKKVLVNTACIMEGTVVG